MQQRKTGKAITGGFILALGLGGQASAYKLYADDDTHLNADVLAVFGWMNSRKNYDGTSGGSTWREGFVKYGLSGDQGLGGRGSAYGALNWVSSGTWGDGDAGGNTIGRERTTRIEDAYLGWRSGDLLPQLGQDGLDLSAGRQVVKLGRGFIVNDDGPNLGQGPADGALDRGGAYYIAARHAFDRTAVVRLGGEDGLHGSAVWLKSDNRAQAETELAAGTLDYTGQAGTLGLTWVHGLDVTDRWASDFQKQREGMDIVSLRGEGDAGIEHAHFAFEYAWQDKDAGREKAWYAEAGYTFAELPWTPDLTYRYTRYSESWDALFTGLSTTYGTWFQGEVAANYAGPFNRNTGIHHLGLTLQPTETVKVGALYFDFRTLHDRQSLDLDARELDFYVEWAATEHLIITPLIGLYQPDKSASNGGNQVGGHGTNVYSQLVVAVPF
ncbi:alginate export family protein [Pseudomonas otitidis]|uniref:alginate export family protein n=1 Tax=Metapseudomonas otitidis TaxID=319939 RepID=UPI00244A5237|nr:alginate export family protein [Pseudomonas otitidis]MDH1109784.1 alginate export family protein [Pseudomonas otitidis]MDH1162080.1 alginate export family protein [Pseudomonas otitidis]MDH1167716.1 alginate export family protein [Pseudomonas otitidis]